MDAALPIGLVASAIVGVAVGLAVAWVIRSLAADDLKQGDEWRYDVSRINGLRRADPIYRMLQPAVQLLARLNRNAFRSDLAETQRRIQVAGLSRFWLAEEYLAKLQIIALLMAPFFAIVVIGQLGPTGILPTLMLVVITFFILRQQLKRRAEKRLLTIKRRLPYLLDLLTLLMEAGSSFLQAMAQGVREFGSQPVAVEFGRVLSDMNMGKARVEAFDALRKRLADDEIGGIVAAILQSEQLGTPISKIFRTQADVLRMKRSQRAEKIAGEAGVNMLLPAMLVMAATVILILGPFILNYMVFGLGI
ncbi:MAG TPA: type II secretion system F family protein [Pirellulaceae bacterium]|nr:type II secretion system F family protein [Pirellulaceae bacterium]